MSGAPALSVVLPCYNEADNLPLLLERYRSAAPAGLDWELVLVQNGSTDGSQAVLEGLLRDPRHAFARLVDVPVNQGYGYGLAQGLRSAKGAVLAFSHADMQCDAQDVFDAHALLLQRGGAGGGVIVKGRRQRRALSQQLLTWGMSAWASLCLLKPMGDINAQPKAFSRALLARLEPLPDGFELDVHVLYRALAAGWRLAELPVHFGVRAHGQSKWAAHTVLRWRTIGRVLLYILTLRLRPIA
jgi:glycosyltransferase involved in cell wall biosynthesis